MNDQTRELLEKYNSELFKVGVHPKKSEDFCGTIGCRGIEDEKIQLEHIAWMVQDLLDSEHIEIKQSLGFIQGILWCTKFRSILELEKENEKLNG